MYILYTYLILCSTWIYMDIQWIYNEYIWIYICIFCIHILYCVRHECIWIYNCTYIYMVYIKQNSTYPCTYISHVHAHERVASHFGQLQHSFKRMVEVSENIYTHAHVFYTITHTNESRHVLGSYSTFSSGWSKSVKTYTHMHMYFTRTRTWRSHVTFWAVTTHFRADGPSQWKHIQTRKCMSHFHKYERVMSHFGQSLHIFERMDEVREKRILTRHDKRQVCHMKKICFPRSQIRFTLTKIRHAASWWMDIDADFDKVFWHGLWRDMNSDRYRVAKTHRIP